MEADPKQFIVSSLICIFNLMSLTDLFNLILLFAFLLGAGLFSGAEVAMFSLSPADLEDRNAIQHTLMEQKSLKHLVLDYKTSCIITNGI